MIYIIYSATGGSVIKAIDILIENNADSNKITFINLMARKALLA